MAEYTDTRAEELIINRLPFKTFKELDEQGELSETQLYFVEDVDLGDKVKVDGVTITKDVDEYISTVGIIEKKTNQDPYFVWVGSKEEYIKGIEEGSIPNNYICFVTDDVSGASSATFRDWREEVVYITGNGTHTTPTEPEQPTPDDPSIPESNYKEDTTVILPEENTPSYIINNTLDEQDKQYIHTNALGTGIYYVFATNIVGERGTAMFKTDKPSVGTVAYYFYGTTIRTLGNVTNVDGDAITVYITDTVDNLNSISRFYHTNSELTVSHYMGSYKVVGPFNITRMYYDYPFHTEFACLGSSPSIGSSVYSFSAPPAGSGVIISGDKSVITNIYSDGSFELNSSYGVRVGTTTEHLRHSIYKCDELH